MGYTDLWKCKVCGTLPEIEMTGKNFVVKCTVCNTPKTRIDGDGLDQVVSLWNLQNKPAAPGLIARIRSLFKKQEEEDEAPEPVKAPTQITSFFKKKEEEEKKKE